MSKLFAPLAHLWTESPAAPGYYAVPDGDSGCKGCSFDGRDKGKTESLCNRHKCYGVIYVPKAEAMVRRLTEVA